MTASPVAAQPPSDVWVIEPRSQGLIARLREVWQYRYLFVYFSKQAYLDIFRESPLNWLWIILRAGLPALIMAFVFGEVAQFSSDTVPYPLFVFVSMIVWHMFEYSLLWATRSMRKYSRLLTRIYFPRIIVLAPSTMYALLMVGMMVGLLVLLSGWYLYQLGIWYLRLDGGPIVALVLMVFAWLFALAFGLWTSVLDAPARDVRYTVRYLLRFWFFLTPIVYPLSSVPERWRWLISANPLTGVVEAFRWGLIGAGEVDVPSLAMSFLFFVAVAVGGLLFFGRAEATMTDRL
jgi:lipopolysaccharide transport system permease protein